MTQLPTHLQALVSKAVETNDQSIVKVSTEFAPPPAGVTVARFVEYIELGVHPQKPFKGVAKADIAKVRLAFDLLAPKNIRTVQIDGVETKICDRQYVDLTMSQSDKSNFMKYFRAMTYGRQDIKHFAQMLGEAFVVTVSHNVSEKAGVKKIYTNLHADGTVNITAPYSVDPLTDERTDVKVPAPMSPIKLFLFDNPTKETWDSLFIDGTRTKKAADGTETQVSKNWLQLSICQATNFSGSALEQMLQGAGALPSLMMAADVPDEEEEEAPAEEKPVAKKKAATKAVASADDLAALGL